MNEFNFLEYQAALKALKICVQDMDDALDGLMFEHGQGGITDRAIGHLNYFNEVHSDAAQKQAVVGKLILKEMARKE